MKLDVIAKNENQKIQNEIISKIRDLINYKNLEPGDKLPSERMLSDKFGVSRSNVREAIQTLEFYGLLKSKPQSGTFVADIGQVAMNEMMEDILRLQEPDFKSLAVEEDLLFHLAIARASGNSTINTLMLVITPGIINNFEKYHVCDKNRAFLGIQEHRAIYEAIKEQNPQLAKEKMKEHFKDLYQFCYNKSI